MAGVDPADDVVLDGASRSIDGVNVWPMLTGAATTRPEGGRFIPTTEASIIDTQTQAAALKQAATEKAAAAQAAAAAEKEKAAAEAENAAMVAAVEGVEVVAFDDERGRFNVKLPTGENVFVKEKNLLLRY